MASPLPICSCHSLQIQIRLVGIIIYGGLAPRRPSPEQLHSRKMSDLFQENSLGLFNHHSGESERIVCSAMLSGDISFSPMYFVLQIFHFFHSDLSYHHCKCLTGYDLYQENSLGLFNHHLLPEAPVSYNQPSIQARNYPDLHG